MSDWDGYDPSDLDWDEPGDGDWELSHEPGDLDCDEPGLDRDEPGDLDWDEPGDGDYEPSDSDLELIHLLARVASVTRPADYDDYADPDAPLSRFLRLAGLEGEDRALYAAALFMLTQRRDELPPLVPVPVLLCLPRADERAAAPDAPLGADRRPADDLTPPVALLRARTVLTAAPPSSRALASAGAAA